MHVEHEADERAFEAGARAHVDGEARAAELGGTLQIQDAELFAKFPVRLGREIEVRLFAPGLNGDIVLFGLAGGNFVARQVGDAGKGEAHLLIERGSGFVEFVEVVFQGARLIHHRGGVFAVPLEGGDLLAEFIAAGLELLGGGDGFAAAADPIGENCPAGRQGRRRGRAVFLRLASRLPRTNPRSSMTLISLLDGGSR